MQSTRLLSNCCYSRREGVRLLQRLSSVPRCSLSFCSHSVKVYLYIRTPKSKVCRFPPLGENHRHRFDSGPSKLVVERILGDLIDLHSSHSSFRQLFRSQSSTGILIECLSPSPGHDDPKVSTQLIHLGSLVAMGNHVSPAQKQQVTRCQMFYSKHTLTRVQFRCWRLSSLGLSRRTRVPRPRPAGLRLFKKRHCERRALVWKNGRARSLSLSGNAIGKRVSTCKATLVCCERATDRGLQA